MKAVRLFVLQLLLALPISAAFAQAAAQPKSTETRAQVKAETLEAFREGDFEVGDTGKKAYEVTPDRYPKRAAPEGETRAQVKSELEAARRDGDLPVGDVGDTPRDIDPKAYPAPPAAPGLTRAQVKQETLAAIRAGDVQIGDSGKTLAQENPSRYAGAPAVPPKLHLRHKAKVADTSSSASASTH